MKGKPVERARGMASATTDLDPAPDDIEATLARHMAMTSAVAGHTKRTAARLAIIGAIRDGVIGPGDLLPGETSLTRILGVSLGTVQAALRQLQQIGTIVRRRGDGSRVASTEPLGSSIWHFRFLAKSDGSPLHLVDEAVEIDVIADQGVWSAFLGQKSRYIRIRRRLVLQRGVRAGAEMVIATDATPGLEQLAPRDLQMINIRPYLEETFGIVTVGATHFVHTTKLDAETAAVFGLKADDDVFEIHAQAYGHDQMPVYFQRIYISANDGILTF